MADYTLTTTTEQESGLTDAVDELNTQRAAQNPPLPAITNQQYVTVRFGGVFDDYVKQMKERTRVSIEKAYGDADAATQTIVKDALGI